MKDMIYGTAWKKEETTKLVKQAVQSGFRRIDTACQPKHYREDLVGLALEELYKEGTIKREDLSLQTKFTPIDGQDMNNMPYLSSDSILVQLEKSFIKSKENLKTDYLDSYLIHSPFAPIEDFIAVYEQMQEYVQAGEVKQIGVSNCYNLDVLKYLFEVAKIKPSVVQNRFYAESSYDKELRAFCTKNNIEYQSFWSLTANPHILSSEIVLELANTYDKTVPQIFYRFLNQIGITPLNGTTSQVHMEEDLSIQSFKMNRKDISSISNLLK